MKFLLSMPIIFDQENIDEMAWFGHTTLTGCVQLVQLSCTLVQNLRVRIY